VIFADLSLRPEAQKLVESFTSGQPKALFQETDVRDWTQLSSLFDTAVREFGDVDIVCPGAGIYEPDFSNFWIPPGTPGSRDATDAGRYALLDINLTHPIRMTQLAIAHFTKNKSLQAGRKSVILISSTAGQKTPFTAPMYAAAKHAINGFVRCLAPLERKAGIRVSAVAPGVVRTPLWTEDASKSIAVEEGKDAWVEPGDVARVMLGLIVEDELQNNEDPERVTTQGGSIIEVTAGNIRNVKAFNDSGPDGRPGSTVSNMSLLEDRVWDLLGIQSEDQRGE
jgi:3-hydroxybutyrate dehydrogenase